MVATYRVTLTQEDIDQLEDITRNGIRAARTVLYARALLLLDQGEFAKAKWTVDHVAVAVGLADRALVRLKERFVQYGLDAALERKKPVRPSRELVFDGEFAARLTQLACSEVPDGYARWTVRLLAEKMVELQIVPAVSAMTVCNTLKKMNFSLIGTNTGKFRRIKTPNS